MIKIKEFLIKLSSFWIYFRWHPEVALRYLPIVERINKLDRKYTILEVGSSGMGITPYLNRLVTGVDNKFKPPYYPLLNRIKASAYNLPFENNSFDVVVSVDMLEHISDEGKKVAIAEMMRVAKRNIFIGVPCGKQAYTQDLILDKYFRKKFGKRYIFLAEQITLGLPEWTEIRDKIYKASQKYEKKIRLKIIGNENLHLRLFLMKGWMTKNPFKNLFFRKILLFAIPIMRLINNEPFYRRIFLIDIL